MFTVSKLQSKELKFIRIFYIFIFIYMYIVSFTVFLLLQFTKFELLYYLFATINIVVYHQLYVTFQTVIQYRLFSCNDWMIQFLCKFIVNKTNTYVLCPSFSSQEIFLIWGEKSFFKTRYLFLIDSKIVT